ncbi:MAG: DUF1835 domain-containing protein, partial [Proteocatella sp.]
MSQFVHIVFGDSAAGTLRYFFKSNQNEFKGQIINFIEELSVGPINGIDTDAGFKKRIQWFKEMLKAVSVYDYFEDVEKMFVDTYDSIKNLDPASKVVIWHGANADNQIALRCLAQMLKNEELYEVNVSESYIEDSRNNLYSPRSLAECAPEKIEKLLPTMKKLENEKRNNLKTDWALLAASKEELRILVDGIVVGVDESYYDDEILSNCTPDFRKAARVIGDTMGRSEQLVSDTYIDYRVRKLIEIGKLEYRGKLESMRDFEIRA